MCVYVCVCVFAHTCVYVFVGVCVYVCMYVCVCMCVFQMNKKKCYSESSLGRTLIRQMFAEEELVFVTPLDKSLCIHWV